MAAGKKRSMPGGVSNDEWDEALCPICLEHPHNAVLLLCSSHSKECRPYVCDTSNRHTNCLDRFRKMVTDSDSSPPINEQSPNDSLEMSGALGGNNGDRDIQLQDLETAASESSMDRKAMTNLKCPLCRGDVEGWKVEEEARRSLDMKARTCSTDSCEFVGNYHQLRRHARIFHPSARPAEIDPSRQQAWRLFEQQKAQDDAVSAIRSSMPGAVVLGDYVIETGVNDWNTAESGRTSDGSNQPSWATSFLLQMLAEPRSRSRGIWSRHRRPSEASSRRRHLWGENLLGARDHVDNDNDDDDDENMISVNDSGPSVRRRRLHEVAVINVNDNDDEDLPVQEPFDLDEN